MEDRRIILADGTIIENGTAGKTSVSLWLHITGMTMAEAAGLFLDPQKTSVITFQFSGSEIVYEGFTECMVLNIDLDGNLSVCMAKAVNE